MSAWKKEPYIKVLFYTVETILILLAVWLVHKLDFIFEPILGVISFFVMPILIAVLIYYITKPLIQFFEKLKLPPGVTFLLLFLCLLVLLVLGVFNVVPLLITQVENVMDQLPSYKKEFTSFLAYLETLPYFKGVDIDQLADKIKPSKFNFTVGQFDKLTSAAGAISGSIAKVGVMLVLIPFIVYYMFKDGKKSARSFICFLPKKWQKTARNYLSEIDTTLSGYISAQCLDCLFVGVCAIILYLTMGVKNAFLFGVITGVTCIIPYIGPILGAIPAVISVVFQDPIKALILIALITVIQEVDGKLVSPHNMGKFLAIHPLTVIVVVIIAGNFGGIVGMLFGIPAYAILRITIKYIYQWLMNRSVDNELLNENGESE